MELPTKYGSQKGNEGSLHDTETTCFLLTKTSVFVDGCCCGLKQHPSEKTKPEHVDLTSRQLQRLTIRLKLRKLVKDIRNGPCTWLKRWNKNMEQGSVWNVIWGGLENLCYAPTDKLQLLCTQTGSYMKMYVYCNSCYDLALICLSNGLSKSIA